MLNLIDNIVLVAVLAMIGLVVISLVIIVENYNNKKKQKASDVITNAKTIAVDNRKR